jgi:hypothetical protein
MVVYNSVIFLEMGINVANIETHAWWWDDHTLTMAFDRMLVEIKGDTSCLWPKACSGLGRMCRLL